MCICGVESGQMYFSVYYTPVRALFLSKYMAAQMGISREKTATVKTLFNAQLDKIRNSKSVQSEVESYWTGSLHKFRQIQMDGEPFEVRIFTNFCCPNDLLKMSQPEGWK